VPVSAMGSLRVACRAASPVWSPVAAQVARLGLVSGWQVRRLLGRASDRTLPGRLVRAGILTAYTVEGAPLPPLYGGGPPAAWPPWDGLTAVNQVVANLLLVRLLSLGPLRGQAFWTVYGCGVQILWRDQRFTVVSFREGGEEENRFEEFLRLYRPGDGRTVVVAAGVGQLGRLAARARRRSWPVRLTWDGALYHLPLARAFCRVGDDGPEPVLMRGLGAEDDGRRW